MLLVNTVIKYDYLDDNTYIQSVVQDKGIIDEYISLLCKFQMRANGLIDEDFRISLKHRGDVAGTSLSDLEVVLNLLWIYLVSYITSCLELQYMRSYFPVQRSIYQVGAQPGILISMILRKSNK